jgi:hypothetical protein
VNWKEYKSRCFKLKNHISSTTAVGKKNLKNFEIIFASNYIFIFLDYFDMLKINFENIKKYYFNTFLNKKYLLY